MTDLAAIAADGMTPLRKRTIEVNAEYWECRESQSERVAVAQLALQYARAETDAARLAEALAEAQRTVAGAQRERDTIDASWVREYDAANARADAAEAGQAALVEALSTVLGQHSGVKDLNLRDYLWPDVAEMVDAVLEDTEAAAAKHDADVLARGAMGARLIRAAEKLLDWWGSRNERGDLITVEWGEPDKYGVYEPTFTVHADDNLLARALTVEAIAPFLGDMLNLPGRMPCSDPTCKDLHLGYCPAELAELAAALREKLLGVGA